LQVYPWFYLQHNLTKFQLEYLQFGFKCKEDINHRRKKIAPLKFSSSLLLECGRYSLLKDMLKTINNTCFQAFLCFSALSATSKNSIMHKNLNQHSKARIFQLPIVAAKNKS